MFTLVQIVGSLLILAAFVASQRGMIAADSRGYLVLNAVGSAVLAACAVVEAQWGFLLLEGIWAIVSIAGLVRRDTDRKAQPVLIAEVTGE